MPCIDPVPNDRELRAWTVEQALIEIAGGKPNYKPNGYYEGWGNVTKLDENTEKLCSFLKKQHPLAIKSYSLELQIWWRDHQEADHAREQAAADAARRKELRRKALAKLTDEERRILGLKA